MRVFSGELVQSGKSLVCPVDKPDLRWSGLSLIGQFFMVGFAVYGSDSLGYRLLVGGIMFLCAVSLYFKDVRDVYVCVWLS